MSSFQGFFYGYFCFVSRAVTHCSPLLCQRAVGASSALPGLPLLGGARRRLLASRGLSPAARCAVVGPGPCVPRRWGCGRLEAAGGGFWPARVAVVVKTTRYEFEQQRYRYAGLSEEDLKQLVSGGSGAAIPASPGAAGPWRRGRAVGRLEESPGRCPGCGGARRVRSGPGAPPRPAQGRGGAGRRRGPVPAGGGAAAEPAVGRCRAAVPVPPPPRGREPDSELGEGERAAPLNRPSFVCCRLPRDLCSKRARVLSSERPRQPSPRCRCFRAVCRVKPLFGGAPAEESTLF